MQKLNISFKKEPEIENLVADKEMGSKILLVASISAKSGEGIDVTIEGATDDPAEAASMMSEEDAEGADKKPEVDETDMAAGEGGSPNTPGGSIEQDMMAAGGPTT